MVNNLVVYSLSCQPSRWIYQPCKASVPGLQLLLIRLARTRIRLAFETTEAVSFSRCKITKSQKAVVRFRQFPSVFGSFCQFLSVYLMSMQNVSVMKFTTLGGSSFILGRHPMAMSSSRYISHHLFRVLTLTPASRASSDFSIDFILRFHSSLFFAPDNLRS